jgi:hypothetical protein
MTAQQQRPTGITILAILGIVGGILGLMGGCGLVGLGAFTGVLGAQAGSGQLGMLAGFTGIWGILILALAIVEIAFGIGAWMLRPWAWILGLIVAGIGIVFAIIDLLAFQQGFLGVVVRLVIYGVIAYYLMTPEVKRAFGRA